MHVKVLKVQADDGKEYNVLGFPETVDNEQAQALIDAARAEANAAKAEAQTAKAEKAAAEEELAQEIQARTMAETQRDAAVEAAAQAKAACEENHFICEFVGEGEADTARTFEVPFEPGFIGLFSSDLEYANSAKGEIIVFLRDLKSTFKAAGFMAVSNGTVGTDGKTGLYINVLTSTSAVGYTVSEPDENGIRRVSFAQVNAMANDGTVNANGYFAAGKTYQVVIKKAV